MQSPYNYFFDETTFSYKFTTKNEIIYSVSFITDNTLNSASGNAFQFSNVYQIIITKLSPALEPLDARVFLTIDAIVIRFFENIKNALLYICSNESGKESKRFKAFNRWYQNSAFQSRIMKLDQEIYVDSDRSMLYMSLITRIDNPLKEELKHAFELMKQALEGNK